MSNSNNFNWVSHTPDLHSNTPQSNPTNTGDNDTCTDTKYYNPEEGNKDTINHPPSPLNPYEKFFLPTVADPVQFAAAARVTTHTVTTQNRRSYTSASEASLSIRTEDDFASAAEELSIVGTEDYSIDPSIDQLSFERALYSDILGLSSPIIETEEDQIPPVREESFVIDEMASKNNQKRKNKNKTSFQKEDIQSSKLSPPTQDLKMAESTPTTTEEEHPHFHVVDQVYEGAKTAWSATKSFPIFTPFLGLAEGVTTKVISIAGAGSSLQEVDEKLKPHLTGIDSDLLDPAIEKIVGLVIGVVGKGDEIFKSLLAVVIKPKGPAIADGDADADATSVAVKETSSEVSAPETSTPAVVEA